MKNFLSFLLMLLLANFSLFAQSMMEGSISNEDGESITATVTLQHSLDTQLNKVINVAEDGYFIIEDIADGAYKLEINKNKYETVTIYNFQFPRDTDQVLGLTLESLEPINSIGVSTDRGPEDYLFVAGKH